MKKTLILWTLVVLCFYLAFAASSGPNFPGTMANTPCSKCQSWVDIDNMKADDGSDATRALSINANTRLATATNFGFAIPTGATIVGYVVVVQAKRTLTDGDNPAFNAVYIYNGAQVGDNKGGAEITTSSMVDYSFGGIADDWNAALVYSDVNGIGFGTQFQIHNYNDTYTANLSVDYVKITVYYTEAASGSKKRIIGHARTATTFK